MMHKGTTHALDEEDLWDLPEEDTAQGLSSRLKKHWLAQLEKKRYVIFEIHPQRTQAKHIPSSCNSPSLTISVLKAFGGPFILASLFKLIQDALAFAQPQLLKRLLAFVGSYSTDKPEAPFHGSIIACGMLFVSVTQTAFLHQYFQRAFETGMRFRGALIDLM